MNKYNIDSKINLTRSGFYGGENSKENIKLPVNMYFRLILPRNKNVFIENVQNSLNGYKNSLNQINQIINRVKYIEMFNSSCIRCGKKKYIKNKELCDHCDFLLNKDLNNTSIKYLKSKIKGSN